MSTRLAPTPNAFTVAVVDHDPSQRRALRAALEPAGYLVAEHHAAATALAENAPAADVVCLDLAHRDVDGIEVLRLLLARDPDVPVIALGDRAAEATTLRAGAWDYLAKPASVEKLIFAVRRAAEKRALSLRVRRMGRDAEEGRERVAILGQSGAMRALLSQLERIAEADGALCVVGEAGSGKELVARAIHERGPRRAGPFVALDCASLPPAQHEAELFGRERGGGAAPARGGLERAQGGTLFLDDVARLAPAVQSALARTLSERAFRRAGGSTALLLGARVIAGSTRPLDEEVRAGHLREELARLVQAGPVRVPPLRERLDDVPILAAHFMARHRAEGGLSAERVTPEAMDALAGHPWTGNVRELENVIHRAMLACDGRELRREHLPGALFERPATAPTPTPTATAVAPPPADTAAAGGDGEAIVRLEELERREIVKALSRTRGNVTKAAVQLGIGRATLYRRLAELELDVPGLGRIGRGRFPPAAGRTAGAGGHAPDGVARLAAHAEAARSRV